MTENQLSVIIVSHNAMAFLDLTLRSLIEATDHILSEIILVDNASTEPIPELVKTHFPEIKLIESSENLGFGKANNLGIDSASSKRILFLNPDTIISKTSIDSALSYFDQNENVGAIGLRMINGKGEFLPESKRSVPGIWSSFSKLIGLGNMFPKSSLFAAYRLGHISEKEISEVEVLSGACMFLNVKETELRKFDSNFFMYGEDIDISFRIGQAGYQVVYLGDETIVHFKGESTNKRQWWYSYWFYKTMWMFRAKHFNGFLNKLVNVFLFPTIWLLMLLAFIKSQFESKNQTIDSGFQTYHIVGTRSPKLELSLQKFQNNAQESKLLRAGLIIINVEYPNYNEVIELLDLKPKEQKVIFWNEEMGRFLGAY